MSLVKLKTAFAIVFLSAPNIGFSAGLGTAVMVQDFEKASTQPTAWVVNVPNENASVALSSNESHDGRRSLKLHYRFVASDKFQYLGIPNKVRIQGPVQKLRYWLKGDGSKCSFGLQITDAGGETHQFKQARLIDFTNWNEAAFNLQSPHETWGGDKNGKLDYPITAFVLTVGQPVEHGKNLAAEGDLFFDSVSADSERSAEEILGGQIAVISPPYCSDITGDTSIALSAPGFKMLTMKCWRQGNGFGSDSTVATVALDAKGNGSFQFPADEFPHGPITLRIFGENGALKDNCYLQLFNKGGVSWNEGMPKQPPPPAQGMSLVFADDFDKPLSISSTDSNATYYDHKPPGGWQDFSAHKFSGFHSEKNPFSQVETYLRIRASDQTHSSGIISSMKNDASGITAKAPCYFECRFLAPNAIGTWPSFWVMTDYMTAQVKGKKVPCDELDIIEAYGGEGPGHPNAGERYQIAPHAWDQSATEKAIADKAFKAINPVRMKKFGIPSTWFETFHIYGCKIAESDTIYYCDNVEVARHPTLTLSKQQPFFFLIDLATGGGWPVDLSRYGGTTDMYVDYVRVYQQK